MAVTAPVARSTVVVLSQRLGAVLPAAALPTLRSAAAVYTDLPADAADTCGQVVSGVWCHSTNWHSRELAGAERVPPVAELTARAAAEPVVLITLDAGGPAARALIGGGAQVVTVAEPPGAALLDAVGVMDRLRSPGGCPWDAEQTHSSLRQYLVEEAYELLDAIEHGDRAALREELGDVLLQVLFHAGIAAEHAGEPFDVDAVASGLVDKLVGRHPHVFAGSERLDTAAAQEARWEELKRDEKRRDSCLDGVAMGQPAAALAGKLVSRARRAGVPADLLPGLAGELPPDLPDVVPGVAGDTPVEPADGAALFAVAARAKLAGLDPESELRAVAVRFAHAVRAAEDAARTAGLDPAVLTPEQWRRFLPGVSAVSDR